MIHSLTTILTPFQYQDHRSRYRDKDKTVPWWQPVDNKLVIEIIFATNYNWMPPEIPEKQWFLRTVMQPLITNELSV